MLAAKSFARVNKKLLYANNIGFNNNNNKIIIVDQLTDTNRHLLREAKQLKRHGFQYIWTKNGKVLVKRREDSDAIIITSIEHIETLKTQNVTI